MTEIEGRILDTLTGLEDAVRTLPTASPKPDLLAFFSRLDELAGQLPSDADPELRHFLQRKSYEKARLLLEGRRGEVARGNCGR
jgi:hypothetical protein